MTQHLLKNSFLRGVLFLLLCAIGLGNAWGEEVTFDATKQGYSNQQVINSATITNGITISFTKGTASPAYYTSGTAIRCYAKGGFTITSTIGDITKIVFTYGSNDGSNAITADVGSFDKNTWTGQASAIKFSIGGEKGNRRIKTITVTYQTSTTPDAPTPELESIDFEAADDIVYYVGETVTEKGLTVTANYTNGTNADVTKDVENWTFTPGTINSINDNSISVEFDYAGKAYNTYSFNITVRSIANTAENAYTVAQACAYIDAGKGLSEEVYVKGIVSQVDNFNDEYGSITYWISDDGTTAGQQFQCYGGLDIDGTQFTSINDLKLGTVVVVKGLLKKYNATYEFDKNNVLISKDESNAITIESITIGGEATKTYYNIGETLSVEGLTVTANYSNSSTIDITEEVEWTFSSETIAKNTTQVTATATYREVYTASKVIDITVDQTELVYGMTSVYGGNSGYATESKITINDIQWSIIGNTNMVPWRIGGKELKNATDRDIKTMSPVYGTVSKVTVSVGKTGGSITFNSLTLSVADNADFTNATTYKETNPKDNTEYTFYITEATDAYYKITYNVTVSSTSNKYYQFNGVKLYGTPASKDISLSNAGYATFCLPYDATIPEGLNAYTATDNGETVKLTAIESGKIAAGEGVVLHGEEGTYTFVATTEDVSATAGNQMVGVTEDTPLTSSDNAYMLTRKKDDGSIAFRLLATDYTLGANKAYLKLENNARNLISVVWDDNATGIYDLSEKEEAENGAIYNLAGQKLTKPQKGINIVNGKLLIH